jgi:uncharacterized protein (DUF1778 family)
MATVQARTSRLEARVTPDQKELIERAAAYQGRTVSDFVVNTVQEAAKAVIQEHDALRLNGLQSRAFVEALLNPPAANETLRQAADDYRKDVVSR